MVTFTNRMDTCKQNLMEKVVVFLGFTGSGKSTATKFIVNDPSLKIEEDLQVT